ncbi:urea ABC transporter permease subunit UrtB [Oscillospiraceae bacterium HV4-5-C5C]|nr:urea ABC transporter permease subunit UrtB [Oscillospiraceae bacterium HV4-5-C5C]
MSPSMLLQLLVSGLASSFVLLLTSLGLVIILGYMKVVNLAHTEMLMSGAFICYYVYQAAGLPFIVALLVAFAVSFLFGALVERLIICHFYGKMSETLLATYALSILLKQAALLLLGKNYKKVDYPVKTVFQWGPVYLESYKLVVAGLAILSLLLTLLFIYKTKTGRMIRAAMQNRSMTESLGINTKKIDTITFAYGMGLAGLAGAIIAPLSTVTYTLGESWLTNTFMNVVMGGVSSLFGTFASSVLIQESVSVISGLSNSVTAQIIVLLVVIVVVRLKPDGLFTAKERR